MQKKAVILSRLGRSKLSIRQSMRIADLSKPLLELARVSHWVPGDVRGAPSHSTRRMLQHSHWGKVTS
jgi:hypothetical protein